MADPQAFTIHAASLTIRGCCPSCRAAGYRCPSCGAEVVRQVPPHLTLPSTGTCQCEACGTDAQVCVVDWCHPAPPTDALGQQLLAHLQRSWNAKPAPKRPDHTGGHSHG
jgi:hypothetical protein